MKKETSIDEFLRGLASMHGRELSPAAAKIFLGVLDRYPTQVVLAALERCSVELRTFPTPADVVARIQQADGRPGADEAWALCPKTEADSVVWTEEVRDAFFEGAFPLIERDEIAARMAFKSCYERKVHEARGAGRPTKWEASLGHDKTHRERVIVEAVQRGHLAVDHARKMLPDISFTLGASQPRLSGPHEKELARITASEVKNV